MWNIVNIETLNICNLRCKHCPYPLMTRKKEIMSLDLFKKVINDSRDIKIKVANLNIYGEPLLDNLLFERIDYCKSKGMEVQFTSNGTLLDSGMAKKIISHKVDKIYFSFDSANKETYEKIRIGASYQEVKYNIMRLGILDNRPKIIIVAVLQDLNQEEKLKIKTMWKGIADAVHCWPMDNRGLLGGKEPASGSWPCYRIFKEVNILSNGLVSLCCLDYDGKEIIGDSKTSSLREIWNQRGFVSLRRLHLRGRRSLIELCKGCELPQREKLSLMREICHILDMPLS